MTDPFGQYSDVLFDGQANLDDVSAAMMAEIERWRTDGLIVRKVRTDSTLHAMLAKRRPVVVERLAAPAISFDRFDDFAGYSKSIASKTRKNLRNYSNRIERLGQLVHLVQRCPTECADVIRRCFSMRSSWLLERGQTSVAFADTSFALIMQGLAEDHRCQPQIRTMQLQLKGCRKKDNAAVDGEMLGELSLHLGFVHNSRYYAYMAAKNPGFDHLSPGRVHMLALIEACSQ